MKRLYSVLLCILLIVSMTITVCAVSSVPDPVIKATKFVVRILAEYPDGYTTGSGFVVKSDKDETLIVTNYHVVEGMPYSISVWISDEETVSATVLAYTSQKDMCILKLAYPVSLDPLTFAQNGVKQGEAVYAVGFPGAADYLSDKEAHTSADATITDGIVSAVREATVSGYGTPTKILQINAAINSGNSGGPLFNVKGEVVGINTYGITDSQGIFGAIDVSELKSFMADYSVPISYNGSSFPLLVLIAASGIAIGIAVGVILAVKKRKKRKVSKKVADKNISLCEYMALYPDGIGMNDAVAMLIPVALQLRDIHNNGRAHLQVSPNAITVGTNGAILADATASEADRYISGFAAPEIYRGISSGNLSDIYSFCAVLSYVVSGKQPANSLSRTDAEAEEGDTELFESAFAKVIKTGMALDPENRFDSMQDVIMKLSPYNVHPFVNSTAIAEPCTPQAIPTKKAKVSAKTVSAVATAILAVALVGTYFGCYIGAKTNAQSGDFAAADRLLFATPITKLHDAKLVAFVDAGQLMAERKYGEAKTAFEKLSGYLNADELAKETDYRHAMQYADANDFDEAFSIMTELSKAKYRDAEDKLLEIQYRKGVYLLMEEGRYSEASKIFVQLAQKQYDGAAQMQKETQYLWGCALILDENYLDAHEKLVAIRGYSDVNDILASLEEAIYVKGQALYRDGNYFGAETWFSCIPSYGDSEKYETLIEAHWTKRNRVSNLMIKKLCDIFYFEDTAELLLSTEEMATKFLCGTWSGDGYDFTMEYDGSMKYNLPWIDYGDYYTIEDGAFLLYPKNNENATKTMWRFTALTPDCIEVFCYKNNGIYILYRQ